MKTVTIAYWLNLGICFSLSIAEVAKAEIVPDTTLPDNSVVTFEGNLIQIEGGTTRGNNLFHSFDRFSVPENFTASFNNAIQIQNIFSRVTGNSLSHIEGIIQSQGAANLFLINPNGIVFGEGASLNIGGSFFATTAESIRFADGTEFNTKFNNSSPLLTISVPIGLNLGTNPGEIINRSINNNVGLKVSTEKIISLTGGNVSFVGGFATAPQGIVSLSGNNVSLLDNARIDVSSATGGGTVVIGGSDRGENSSIDTSRIYIDNTVTINANSLTNGNGGRVFIKADEVTGFYGNIYAKGGTQFGNGGFVEISAKEHLIFRGNVDTTAVNGFTGTLLLDPTNIIIADGSGDEAEDGTDAFAGNNSGEVGAILSTPLSEINDTAPTTIYESELEGLSGNTNVILQATNNITIEDLTDDELSFAPGSGVIAFTADADRDGAGNFVMEDNTIVFDNELSEIIDDADTIKTNGRSIIISGANLTLGNINTAQSASDAGETIETASILSNSSNANNVESISGFLSEIDDRDIYQVFLTGDGTFSATTVNSKDPDIDTQLFLFDAAGKGIYSNDDVSGVIFQSTLPSGHPLTPTTPGIYYLAISGLEIEPLSEGGFIFPIDNFQGVNAPTGEGGTLPLSDWEDEFVNEIPEFFENNIGEYTIDLTGVVGSRSTFKENEIVGNSGSITLNATNGNINLGNLNSSADFAEGGNITVNATGDITSVGGRSINISSLSNEANAGTISLNSSQGNLNLINSSLSSISNAENGISGDINFTAGSNIFLNNTNIDTYINGLQGIPGDINLTANSNISLTNTNINYNASRNENRTGDITLESLNRGNVELISDLDSIIFTGTATKIPGEETGGDIKIIGGKITINSYSLNNTVTRQGNGGDILITGKSVNIQNFANNPEPTIATFTLDEGNAGNVFISADSVIIGDASLISTQTSDTGNAGNITIDVTNGGRFLLDNSQIISTSIEGGNVGNITVNAGSILLSNEAEIEAATFGTSVENTDIVPAKINLNASGDITIKDSLITTRTRVERNGSDIEMSASSVNIADRSAITTETRGLGNTGNISINVTNGFNLSNSFILTSTFNLGKAGDITINAGSILLAERAKIAAEVALQPISIIDDEAINSEIFLFNDRGNLLAENDNSALLENEAGIFSSRNSFLEYTFTENGTYVIGVGAFDSFVEAGEIKGNTIAPGQNYTLQVSIENRQTTRNANGLVAKIEPNNSLATAQNIDNSFSNKFNSNIQNSTSIPHISISAAGDGTFDYYSFNATAGSLGIFDIDQFFPDNTDVQPGQEILAGNINLNATGDITISNNSTVSASTARRSFRGGSVNITTPNLLTIQDNSTVRVDSEGLATSGNISTISSFLTLKNNGQIFATTASGEGGFLNIKVDNILEMQNSSSISTAAGESGNGGNIEIDTKFILAYPKQNNDIVADAGEGNGGNIRIKTESLFGIEEGSLNSSTNDLNASSDFGLDGNVALEIPDVDPASGLVKLPDTPIDAEAILARDLCKVEDEKIASGSSFIITGRGGLTPTSEEPLDDLDGVVGWSNRDDLKVSKNDLVEIGQNSTNNTPEKSYPVISEAQGWVITSDGNVKLIVNAPKIMPQNLEIVHPDCQTRS